MTLECFKKQFADSKRKMTLTDAADYIHEMLDKIFPLLPKAAGIRHEEYVRRLMQRTACMEAERVIREASPWQDYREIFAELEWPCMRRVLSHMIEERYDEPYGEKEGIADAWFVEMWFGYHKIFECMPGVIPDNIPWRRYRVMVDNVEKKMKKYRRKL